MVASTFGTMFGHALGLSGGLGWTISCLAADAGRDAMQTGWLFVADLVAAGFGALLLRRSTVRTSGP